MQAVLVQKPHINNEIDFLNDAFGSTTAELEQLLVAKLNLKLHLQLKQAVFLSNVSAAIQLGLTALNVTAGDYVLVQSLASVATAFPISYLNATPVFIDSAEDNLGMCPKSLEKAIQLCLKGEVKTKTNADAKLPKAIVVSHVFGYAAKIKEIIAVANKYGIAVLEDASAALGSTCEHQPCGTLGDVGVLAIHPGHVLSNEGIAILTAKNENVIAKVKHLLADDSLAPADQTVLTYNYSATNVSLSMALMQIDQYCLKQSANNFAADFYTAYLPKLKHVVAMPLANNSLKPNQQYTFLTTSLDKNKLIMGLNNHKIAANAIWLPLHQQPVYNNCTFVGRGNADDYFANGIVIANTALTDGQDTNKLKKVLDELFYTT